MNSPRPTDHPGSPGLRRARARAAAVLAAAALGLALTSCGGPESPGPAAGDPLTVDVTIAGGDVSPNGQKLDVAVGQEVVLNVTSDEDDEIHAHTGGDGFELEVEAGQPATGRFTLAGAGSFEVESHHLEKVIVILNAR